LAINLTELDVSLLDQADIDVDVLNNVTVRDIANNNNIGLGLVIQALGGVAGVVGRQAQ
jgi:hypothetical protein